MTEFSSKFAIIAAAVLVPTGLALGALAIGSDTGAPPVRVEDATVQMHAPTGHGADRGAAGGVDDGADRGADGGVDREERDPSAGEDDPDSRDDDPSSSPSSPAPNRPAPAPPAAAPIPVQPVQPVQPVVPYYGDDDWDDDLDDDGDDYYGDDDWDD